MPVIVSDIICPAVHILGTWALRPWVAGGLKSWGTGRTVVHLLGRSFARMFIRYDVCSLGSLFARTFAQMDGRKSPPCVR